MKFKSLTNYLIKSYSFKFGNGFYVKKSLIRFYSNEENEKISLEVDDGPKLARSIAEQELLYIQNPSDMPENPKLLKTTVLGVPNVGKSTLINRLMNKRISAVSHKINTTRNRINAVLTNDNVQIIINDTPGLVSFKKSKKFNLERRMIIDPHSSLWDSDLIIVVHDISDEYSRSKINSEIIKCLFSHPEKESILVLNKTDKLKNKKVLLDLVADLTGGCLNGKQFLEKIKPKKNIYLRNSLRDSEYESLFERTAEKMNLNLTNKKAETLKELLEELRICEEYLLKNQNKISFKSFEQSNETDTDDQIKKNVELETQQRINLEKLSPDYIPEKMCQTPNSSVENNKALELTNSIISQTKPSIDTPALRSIKDISPIDFKRDILQTTDWHLYYSKLSSLSELVREKTYWPYFSQVFMISAKTNDGVEDLKRYMFSRAQPGNWIFSRNMLTDQMPQEIAEMCVREKMLKHLNEEIPYELGLRTTHWEVDDNDCLNIIISVIPSSSPSKYKRQTNALFARSAAYLKLISQEAHQELMNIFQCEVKFKLVVENR